MSGEVRRYDCTNGGAQHCYGCYTMTEVNEGDYVAWDDYADLLARHEAVVGDAARYRFLRDNQGAKSEDGTGLLVAIDNPSGMVRYIGPVLGADLDRRLDRAIQDSGSPG